MKKFDWFKWSSDSIDNAKLLLVAREDRWNFVGVCCLKAQGVLDSDAPNLEGRVAVKLRLTPAEAAEAKRRLVEVGLIDEGWQPVGWDEHQPKLDNTATLRKQKQRERERMSQDVTRDTRDRHGTDIEKELEGEKELELRQEDLGLLAQPESANGSSVTGSSQADPQGFAELQAIFPKRSGSHRWADARSAMRARLREGTPVATILDGVRRYARYVREKGIEGTSTVQQAATFVGTNRCFLEPWELEPRRSRDGNVQRDPYAGAV